MRKVIFTLGFLLSIASAFAQTLLITAPSPLKDIYCPGSTLSMTVKTTGGNYGSSYYYGVQLSNTSGSFSSGTMILGYNNVAANNAGSGKTFTATFPSTTGTQYRVRPVALNTSNLTVARSGSENGSDITIGYPSVDNPGTKTFCPGSASVNLNGDNEGSLTWTNSNTGIGLAASGTGNLSFTATNSSGAPISSTVTVTPWSDVNGTGCSGTSQGFSIVINPKPNVNPVSDQTLCMGTSTSAVSFSGSISGTTFSWTNNNTSIGLSSSGSGNIGSFTGTNTSGVVATGTINVTPKYTNNSVTCSGTAGSFTITVNPKAWTGVSSSDWNTSPNWSCGIPTSADNVVITSGTPFAPTVLSTTSGSVKNLTLNSGVNLTVNGTMNIGGSYTNNGVLTCGNGAVINAPNASITFPTPGPLPTLIVQTLILSGLGTYSTGGNIDATTLNLSSKAKLNLADNNLTFNSVSNVTNSAYVIAEGAGLMKHSGNATFPVGTTAGYSPVTITNGTSYTWGVNMTTGFSGSLGATGSARSLQRIWKITPFTSGVAQTTTNGTTLSFQFPTSDTSGTKMNLTNGGSAKVYHWDGNGTGWSYGWQFVGNGNVSQNSSTTTVYNITASSFSPFAITSTSNVLPVTLLSFNGKRQGSRNILNWSTVTEQNNRGFDIERSTDGLTYTSIGFVKSLATGGESTSELAYRFEDVISGGRFYYRLRQVDIDNKFTYSKVVKLSAQSGKENAVSGLYPNPAAAQITALVEATDRGSILMTVVDALGRPVLRRTATVVNGTNSINLGIGNLTRGRYLLQVLYPDQTRSTTSFIKQ
ncbi:T9SS type A sorting domain-containing protein [Flaviaesturariibacter flavus]|uniref:T9SS type A sorting domain-containing protein n=1 Tax=Flaviaesturariibacter flavus TaxID=2502780 RepID=A0A4R1B7G8_9BACT|nr:T9SS type A sorting domain-containing protein [Flaviaesturariibacter flavus]TCJ12488.1 T9SS type A sorting domain-containing protein [Flaviaesturariibacter flavus]